MSFLAVVGLPASAQAASQVAADFNGDGLSDIALGVPEENLSGAGNGGAVNVIYGSPTGLNASGSQFWSQESPGIEDIPETGDRFGHAVAGGDFNGDGFDDMAVGAQREDIGTIADAGAVNVIYGSAAGLTATGNQFWSQDVLDVEDVAETGDHFGSSLSAGQSDAGLGDELAIGAPMDSVGGISQGGVAHVLRGSAAGLTATGDQLWHENISGVDDQVEGTERFGSVVAWGDFNGNGFDDLAITIPREFTGSFRGGATAVIYGTSTGPNVSGNQHWTQDSPGIEDFARGGDMVRSSLAVGDFDADGRDDLVMGFDGENIGSISHTGAANVIYGTAAGLNAADDQFWYQNLPGIEDNSEGGDNLAWALTAGDLDGDGDDDLALAARREDLGPITNAGAVNVIPGSPGAGLTDSGDILITQNSPGIEEDAEADDEFGSALFAGDTNGDGRDELGIGVILENVGAVADAGVANVLYNTFSGGANQLWHQDVAGIDDQVESGDRLGYAFPG